jgi:anti-sigma factor RsiW
MMTDKYIEKLLDLYFKGELSQEEKEKLFESLRSNPSLNDTVQYVLSHVDPSKAESFLAEKSLMCDTEIISESDETLIELYLSGLMSQEEEDDFLKKLVADTDLRTNALAQAFLIKAIRKIQNEDNRVLEAAKNTSVSDINSLFEELQTEDDDMLIDSYLQGNLSESEIEAFQERLNSDKEFKERVAAITILAKGIQIQQEQDNKIIKDAKSLSKEDIIATINDAAQKPVAATIPYAASQEPAAVQEPAAASRPGHTWYRRMAAAAVVLIVVGIGWDYHNSSVSMNYADQGIEKAVSDLPGERFIKGDGEDVADELRVLFENVRKKNDLPLTITKLEKLYNSATDEYAHVEDDYVDQISLALASAYIYDGQKTKAKDVLNHLINDPDAAPEIKDKAKQMLDNIRKTFIF